MYGVDLFVAQVAMKSASCSVQQALPALIPMVEQKRLRPEEIVSQQITLDEGAFAYRTFADRAPGTGKVVRTVE